MPNWERLERQYLTPKEYDECNNCANVGELRHGICKECRQDAKDAKNEMQFECQRDEKLERE